jgi:hypothetical protein
MKKMRKMKAYTRFILRLIFFKLINIELEFVNPYLFDCKIVSRFRKFSLEKHFNLIFIPIEFRFLSSSKLFEAYL